MAGIPVTVITGFLGSGKTTLLSRLLASPVFADTAVLGGYADAVMLVARAGVTPFDALVECAEQCRRARLPVLGTLLNDIDPDRDREYDAAYKWQSYAQSYYTASQV